MRTKVDYLEIGKIINTHGLKGYLKVLPLTDNPERFEKLHEIMVKSVSGISHYKIERIAYLKEFVLLKLEGVDTIEQADVFRNLFIIIDRKHAIRLPVDSYFVCDIIGLRVIDRELGELGVITEVIATGSNDVYVVKNGEIPEVLIPALKSVVKEVNLDKGYIIIVLPDGLIEDEKV